jgi:hypothetical protein
MREMNDLQIQNWLTYWGNAKMVNLDAIRAFENVFQARKYCECMRIGVFTDVTDLQIWNALQAMRRSEHLDNGEIAVSGPEGFFDEPFEKSDDTDTVLKAAAREAGWALSTLVDEIRFNKRQQVVNIINRLSAAFAYEARTNPPSIS